MSFRYTLRESFSGFKRARLSSIISITTITISLLLLGVFTVFSLHASRFIDTLRNKFEIEAFLEEPLTRQELADLRGRVTEIEGVERIVYVSKEEAARIFKEEFGEDIKNVLDFNPLPPSFKIYLKDGYKTAAQAEVIHDRLKSLKGIGSIVYRKALLELIDKRTGTVNNLTLGLGTLISLSAIFLVSNTIRLAIYAKRHLLRTMELVGATRSFIRLPFLVEGMIQGLVGGVLASFVFYVLLEYVARVLSVEFSEFIHMDPVFYLLVIGAGTLLGLVGSVISVIRFIRLAAA